MRPFRFAWSAFSLLSGLAAAGPMAEPAPNLIPNGELRGGADGTAAPWTLWTPRPAIAATGRAESRAGVPVLTLQAETYASVGKWMNVVPNVVAGQHYHFEVEHRSHGLASDATSAVVILSWYRTPDAQGEIQRDYILVADEREGWVRSARTLQAPNESQSVRVELGLRWSAPGAFVEYRSPRLTAVAAPAPRPVRIVTTRILPDITTATVEGNTRLMAEMFDRVGPLQPDVVVFSENLATRFVRRPMAERVQTVPGPLTEMLAAKARQYRTHAVATLLEVDGELYHNTAVLIDRDGRIAGKYRKVHLTMGETEAGLTPGTEYPVFATDFGRVGLLTCWDNWFNESARALRLKGAEMLIMPLAGDGSSVHWDITWKARAIDNGVWFVTSSTVTDSPSRIIDPMGQVVADASGPYGYAVADVDLNQEWRQRYMSVGNGYGEPPRFLIKERRPETYAPLTKAHAVETVPQP